MKVHVKAILRKIRVQNRTQAAIWGMNNGSLTRPENNSYPPSTSDATKRLPNAADAIKQIETSVLPVIVGTNHVEVTRIDRLIGKGINGKSNGTERLGK